MVTKIVNQVEVEKVIDNKIRLNKLQESESFNIIHKNVKDRVLSILKGDKYSRKNDFYLCMVYWIKCGFIKMQIDLKDFDKVTKPESISRCRRELIKEAKEGNLDLQFLLKDKEVLDKRETLKELNRRYYAK